MSGVEQTGDNDVAPDRCFTGFRLQNGIICRIFECDRLRAERHQGVFDLPVIIVGSGDRDLDPGHERDLVEYGS